MEFVYVSIIIILDQLTKFLAKSKLMPIGDITLIPGYFSFSYVENRGAAFGMFRNKKLLLVGVTAIIIFIMIYYLVKKRNMNKLLKIGFILIIGGAVGNLIDRIYLGYVVDYMHFYIKDIFDWPVFNVADISVVTGTILVAFTLLFTKDY